MLDILGAVGPMLAFAGVLLWIFGPDIRVGGWLGETFRLICIVFVVAVGVWFLVVLRDAGESVVRLDHAAGRLERAAERLEDVATRLERASDSSGTTVASQDLVLARIGAVVVAGAQEARESDAGTGARR